MAGLSLSLLGEHELLADPHPDLNVRLVIDGITHDPGGQEPPCRVEVRMSPSMLTGLAGQIRAVQQARAVAERTRAERESRREQERAAEAAVHDGRVDTGVLRRIASALRSPEQLDSGRAGEEGIGISGSNYMS